MARISKEEQLRIRQKIKDVAREKFSIDGFDKTSTKQIAREVGIAEGTLFNYFDSKTEIFFESFGDDYEKYGTHFDEEVDFSGSVTEIIYNHFEKTVGMMMKIPRGIMGELAIASVRMAKRKPEKFKKLVAYDFQFIDEIGEYIKRLIENNVLDDVDSNLLSEILFSVIGYEFLLYVYDPSVIREDMVNNIKLKIDIVIKGYLKGGTK